MLVVRFERRTARGHVVEMVSTSCVRAGRRKAQQYGPVPKAGSKVYDGTQRARIPDRAVCGSARDGLRAFGLDGPRRGGAGNQPPPLLHFLSPALLYLRGTAGGQRERQRQARRERERRGSENNTQPHLAAALAALAALAAGKGAGRAGVIHYTWRWDFWASQAKQGRAMAEPRQRICMAVQ